MKPIFSPAALFGLALTVSLPAGAAETRSLDISGVTRVSIVGDASRVRLTTADGQPNVARLTSRPSGWLGRWTTLWSSAACGNAGEMSMTNSALAIRIAPSALGNLSDCAVTVEANLPAGGDVAIDQAATEASLHGRFGSIRLDGKAADIDIDGHATSIVSTGDATRMRIRFATTDDNEEISLTSRALDTDLSLGAEVVSDRIDTIASTLDSTLVNTPGARPAIAIKADFLCARIR